MKKNLLNKIALVTGSTRGIGKSIAIELANQGAIVLLHGSKESADAKLLLKELQKVSPKSCLYYARIEDYNDVSQMAKQIEKDFLYIDILVNNAGIAKSNTFLNMSNEEWDIVIKVNVYGTYYVTKLLAPLIIRAGKGKIINMSSVYGLTGEYGQINYSTSKSAIIGFTKALSKELAKKNISVNAVCPGLMDTGLIHEIPEKYLKKRMENIPLERLGKKEEVAKLIAFLSSDDADYITGQAIHINGGMF